MSPIASSPSPPRTPGYTWGLTLCLVSLLATASLLRNNLPSPSLSPSSSSSSSSSSSASRSIGASSIRGNPFHHTTRDSRSLAVVTRAAPARQWVGVNWGLGFATAPLAPVEAVRIILQTGATAVKLFSPDKDAYAALSGTGLEVMTASFSFESFANSDAAALTWVDENVVPYLPGLRITSIAVGNEVLNMGPPMEVIAQLVPAMRAIHRALVLRGLDQQIKVVSPQSTAFLVNTYPVSASTVMPAFEAAFTDLLDFVNSTGSYLVINCYPYFAYRDNQAQIAEDFTFFRGADGYFDNRLYYGNLFDAMLDGPVVAAEKLGFGNVNIVVGETGWPTAGHPIANIPNALEWNRALMGKIHSGRGTPKRPTQPIRAYIFELFDQDQKSLDIGSQEPYWGFLYMNGSEKYPFNLATPYPAPNNLPPPKWCMVSLDALPTEIQAAIDYACGSPSIDCATLVAGCPEALRPAAIFNAYFQAQGQMPTACDFNGAAQVSVRLPRSFLASTCPFPGVPTGL